MTARRSRWMELAIPALAFGTCLSLATLIVFSYQALHEWRHTESLLAERRAQERAERLVTALLRDMRGAQRMILTAGWNDLPLDPAYDARSLVGSTFARYPYPESFFAWRRAVPAQPMVFFNRSDRAPSWLRGDAGRDVFPVSLAHDADTAGRILERAGADARQGRRFSTFEMTIGGERYQVVAGLFYRDAFHEELDRVVGFTVNMAWARRHYFPEMARQVARIGDGPPLVVVDEGGRLVAGSAVPRGAAVTRSFPVIFFDPLLVDAGSSRTFTARSWFVQARVADDAGLAAATSGAERTLLVATVAVATLAVGLLLTARAARASARVAAMRSEFVSTVTHELKTPIATIRAIGETLVRGRVSGPGAQREYAQLVVQEARRLGRLVENLLAYARITDVTEVYSFEPLDARQLVDEALRGFRVPLAEAGFVVEVEAAERVPPIRGDRTALGLALDNVVDNAIRYSDGVKQLAIRIVPGGQQAVTIEIRDRGIGIAPEDLPHVTTRFHSGGRPRASGSGLGLAIVERIVQDHGGSLGIASRPGDGTTVRMTLPAAG